MKIVVVGGSGRIGSKLVAMLTRGGHDVVAASRRSVAGIATGSPLNGTVEIGGPEPFYLDGLLQRVLGARNDPREVIADAHARYFGAQLDERALLPGDEAELGEIRFDDWLGRTAPPMANANVQPAAAGVNTGRSPLEENEFRIGEVPPGSVPLVGDCAVFNIEGGDEHERADGENTALGMSGTSVSCANQNSDPATHLVIPGSVFASDNGSRRVSV